MEYRIHEKAHSITNKEILGSPSHTRSSITEMNDILSGILGRGAVTVIFDTTSFNPVSINPESLGYIFFCLLDSELQDLDDLRRG